MLPQSLRFLTSTPGFFYLTSQLFIGAQGGLPSLPLWRSAHPGGCTLHSYPFTPGGLEGCAKTGEAPSGSHGPSPSPVHRVVHKHPPLSLSVFEESRGLPALPELKDRILSLTSGSEVLQPAVFISFPWPTLKCSSLLRRNPPSDE